MSLQRAIVGAYHIRPISPARDFYCLRRHISRSLKLIFVFTYQKVVVALAVCDADTDECELNTAICGIGRCINTVGNYTCVCPVGHMLTPDNNCMGSYYTLYLLNASCDFLHLRNAVSQ